MKLTVSDFLNKCSSDPEILTAVFTAVYCNKKYRVTNSDEMTSFMSWASDKEIKDFEIYNSLNGFSLILYIF